MNDDHGKAKTIFLRAAEIAAANERQAYLAAACGGDDALRGEVEDLLRHQERLGSFLEPAPGGPATLDLPVLKEAPGTQIGPYKLLQQIGEGGMGTVYMAEQTRPVQRKVALKLIKPGMDSRQVIARFEAERQALAIMDHVNIARVFDGGTSEAGLPYFVMELVHGVPITRYCDDNHLTPRERLELFVPVCQAIQHAHQKGIIHRDIKPSNVMVTLYDGKPVPKVIDFGVAKATEQKLTERTLFTQYGTMVGTLEYMSPEQAEMSALGVDTRSDIYSLGVLLYELLTGSTPLTHQRIKEAAYGEILRMIKEEEPQKPSTRLSDSGEALASISANRHTEPAKLAKQVRGELDWIVMKTLEKDRNRRYETANGFAMDVQRYLNDEPVQACPPSASYRFRKFVRRNKRVLASAAVLGVMLLLGVVLLAVNNVQIKEEQQRTDAEKTRAEIALGESKENLELADENLGLALEALDEVYMKEIEKRVLQKRQLTPADREFLQKGLRFYEQFGKRNSTHVGLQGATAKANRRAGYLRLELAQWPEAVVHFRKAIPLLEKLAAESPTTVELRRELASSRHGLSIGLRRAGSLGEAETTCRQAIALWQQLAAEFPAEHHYRVLLGHSLWELHEIFSLKGHHQEAEEPARQALKLFEQLRIEFPRELYYQQETAYSRRHLAFSLKARGRIPEAVENYQQAVLLYGGLVGDSPDNLWYRVELANSHAGLGHALKDSRRTQEAEDAYRQAVNLHEKLVQKAPMVVDYRKRLACSQSDLAQLLVETKHFPEAELYFRRGLAVYKELAAEYPAEPDYWYHMGRQSYALADLHKAAGRPAEVKQAYEQAVEAYRPAVPLYQKRAADAPTSANLWQLADCLGWLGEALRQAGQPEEAIKVWRESASVLEKLVNESNLPDYRGRLAERHGQVGTVLEAAGRHREAETAYRRSVAVYEKLVADFPNIAAVAEYRARLGWSYGELIANLMDQGKKQEAEALAAAAQDLVREAIKRCPENAEAQNNLAWNLIRFAGPRRCDPAEVVALAKKAVARAPDAPHIVNTLGMAYYRSGDWNAAIDTLMRADELYGGRMFSANAFFIAMAHWQRGEKEQARKWYAPALVWMEKYAPKNDELLRFRAEAASLLGLPERLAPEQGLTKADDLKYYTLVLEAHPKAAWGYAARGILREAAKQDAAAKADYRRALELFTNAVDRAPKAAWPYQQRGTAYARLDHWDKAEADFAKAVELRVDGPVSWYYLALVRLHRGDGDGSRKACTGMLVRFGPSGNANAEYWTTWTCILAPDGVADWTRPVQLAEHLLSTDPNNFLKLNLLGAVLYRAGRFKEAAKRLAEAEAALEQAKQPQSSIVYGWLFQAMTQHRLGHTADAKRWLEKAVKEIDQPSTEAAVAWNRRVTLDLLRREAEELLRKKSEAKNE